MDSFLAILLGIGLAAACGFRVFVPLLAVSVAARAGFVELSDGFAWISTTPAMVALSVATIAEIGAYYVPWLDNLLDSIASPAAVAAGTLLFAASVTEFDPLWQWSLALVAGGGSAAVVQGGTVATRAASTTTTGGTANFLVSTLETLAGVVFSVLAIVVPVLAVILLVATAGALYYIGRRVLRRFFRSRVQTHA